MFSASILSSNSKRLLGSETKPYSQDRRTTDPGEELVKDESLNDVKPCTFQHTLSFFPLLLSSRIRIPTFIIPMNTETATCVKPHLRSLVV